MTVSWNEDQAIRQALWLTVRLKLKRSGIDRYVAISRKMSSGNTALRATAPLDEESFKERVKRCVRALAMSLCVGLVWPKTYETIYSEIHSIYSRTNTRWGCSYQDHRCLAGDSDASASVLSGQR